MRWRIPAVLLLATFFATSCDQTVPTAADDSASDVPTLKVIENAWYDGTWEFPHCEEMIDVVYRYKMLETYTESASGNYNYQWKFTIHGRAVGRDTGYEYVWNNSFDWAPHQHGRAAGAPYTESFTDNWVIVGKGKAPNWKAKITSQVTVNANGDVKVDFFKYHETCK